jgi:hypothetical protein
MRCRLERMGGSGQQCGIEGGDEDSVSKLADREAMALNTVRGDTAAML